MDVEALYAEMERDRRHSERVRPPAGSLLASHMVEAEAEAVEVAAQLKPHGEQFAVQEANHSFFLALQSERGVAAVPRGKDGAHR